LADTTSSSPSTATVPRTQERSSTVTDSDHVDASSRWSTSSRLPRATGSPIALGSLDDVLHREDASTWSESVTVDGDELVVSANSEVRFRRLRSLVESAVPGLGLMREEAKPAADLMAAGGAAALLPPPTVPVEAAGALAGFMREQEDRWLEEQIPALEGLTPRQAAADPTRREELEALLREFDRMQPPPGALTFDTSRLRSLLGLPGR